MSKVQTIVDQLKDLTLVEASELVKLIEETFEVSASAPAGFAMAAPVGSGGDAPVVEEKTEFTVKIVEVPSDKKISVIKAVKTIMNIGLADAKAKVESAPFVVIENANKEDANKFKDDLSSAGATVVLE